MTNKLPSASTLYGRPGLRVVRIRHLPDKETDGWHLHISAHWHPCEVAQTRRPCAGCDWTVPAGRGAICYTMPSWGATTRLYIKTLTPAPCADFRLARPPFIRSFDARGLEDALVAVVRSRSLSEAARTFGIPDDLLRPPFRELVRLSLRHTPSLPERVSTVSMDGVFVLGKVFTVVGVPRGGGPVLEVLADESIDGLAAWLGKQPWIIRITRFVIDPDPDLWKAIKKARPDAVIQWDIRHIIEWEHKVLRHLCADTLGGGERGSVTDGGRRLDKLRAALEADPYPGVKKPNLTTSARDKSRIERKRGRLREQQRVRRNAFHRSIALKNGYRVHRRFMALVGHAKDREQAIRWFCLWGKRIPPELKDYFGELEDKLTLPDTPEEVRLDGNGVPIFNGFAEPFFEFFNDKSHRTSGFIEAVNRQVKEQVAGSRGNPDHGTIRLRILHAFDGISERTIRSWARDIITGMYED